MEAREHCGLCSRRYSWPGRAKVPHRCRRLTLPSRGQLPAYGLQLPVMSNVGRHKKHVSESRAPHRCSPAVKASGSVRVSIGCAARKKNAHASLEARASRLCSGFQRPWLFVQESNTCFSQPPREGLSSSIGAGAIAPPKVNVGQSVGAAAQWTSARSSSCRTARQRGRWRSSRTSLFHRR